MTGWAGRAWTTADVRLPPLADAEMTDAQRTAVQRFRETRGIEVFGPFLPLLRSPELMLRVSATGEYVRYNSALPPRLSEFAILVVARFWTQPFEWGVHQPIALRSGVPESVARAIEEGRRPDDMTDDQAAVYDFCEQVLRTHEVTDAAYARAIAALGEAGVVDLLGILGHYSMLAMVLNVARMR